MTEPDNTSNTVESAEPREAAAQARPLSQKAAIISAVIALCALVFTGIAACNASRSATAAEASSETATSALSLASMVAKSAGAVLSINPTVHFTNYCEQTDDKPLYIEVWLTNRGNSATDMDSIFLTLSGIGSLAPVGLSGSGTDQTNPDRYKEGPISIAQHAITYLGFTEDCSNLATALGVTSRSEVTSDLLEKAGVQVTGAVPFGTFEPPMPPEAESGTVAGIQFLFEGHELRPL